MSKIIEFRIVSKDKNLHGDFLMKIPSLNREYFLDTYYFWNGEYDTDSYDILQPLIDSYLRKCQDSVLSLLDEEITYLPVDFSDQYYGIFKVTCIKRNFSYTVQYGSVEKTMKTYFSKINNHLIFTIGDETFNEDFNLIMQLYDIIDSFSLS